MSRVALSVVPLQWFLPDKQGRTYRLEGIRSTAQEDSILFDPRPFARYRSPQGYIALMLSEKVR